MQINSHSFFGNVPLTLGKLSWAIRLGAVTEKRVIVKSGTWLDEVGSDLVDLWHLDSIFEFDSPYDLFEIIETT